MCSISFPSHMKRERQSAIRISQSLSRARPASSTHVRTLEPRPKTPSLVRRRRLIGSPAAHCSRLSRLRGEATVNGARIPHSAARSLVVHIGIHVKAPNAEWTETPSSNTRRRIQPPATSLRAPPPNCSTSTPSPPSSEPAVAADSPSGPALVRELEQAHLPALAHSTSTPPSYLIRRSRDRNRNSNSNSTPVHQFRDSAWPPWPRNRRRASSSTTSSSPPRPHRQQHRAPRGDRVMARLPTRLPHRRLTTRPRPRTTRA